MELVLDQNEKNNVIILSRFHLKKKKKKKKRTWVNILKAIM